MNMRKNVFNLLVCVIVAFQSQFGEVLAMLRGGFSRTVSAADDHRCRGGADEKIENVRGG